MTEKSGTMWAPPVLWENNQTAKLLILLVGGAGIEPATPAV